MLGLNHANRDGHRGVYHRARIRATRWLHPSYALLEILYKSHAPVSRAIGRSTRFDVARNTIGCQAFVRCKLDHTRFERAGP